MSIVERVHPLGFVWETADPFLFCVHHDDAYPVANEAMGPAASLAGRDIGQDFAGKDGWRMYHGETVPGFPAHPHRGFETITYVRKGLIDHSDSLGAAARFGRGDVQWLTAGNGIVHAEMFPLLEKDRGNPVELFQIWLNLAPEDKLAPPHFAIFWDHDVPRREHRDAAGRTTTVTVAAGRLGDLAAPHSPPSSWAARPESDLAVATIALDAGATYTLPAARPGTNRKLYLFEGGPLMVGDRKLEGKVGAQLRPDVDAPLVNGPMPSQLLLLQARPIGHPVAQHGPFVMNTQTELRQAFQDYQRTRFGGWPHPSPAPVHPREEGRFARYIDGRVERPERT